MAVQSLFSLLLISALAQAPVDIGKLLPPGQTALSFIGKPGPKSALQVAVLLQPTLATKDLRRGSVIVAERESANTRDWKLVPPAEYPVEFASAYAQLGDNAPFFVDEQLTDEDIIAIASFIRSRPVIPQTRGRSISASPIFLVRKGSADSFDVWLLNRNEFQLVEIHRGHTWTVVRAVTYGF